MYNSELKTYSFDLGERILSESEMKELGISRNAGVIDENGIIYLLIDGINDKNHELLVEHLSKNGITDLTTYIKYNSGAKYIAKAVAQNYISGATLPYSFAVCHDEEKPVAITPKMAIALYNLYYQFTPFVTTAVAECVEGLGWSKLVNLTDVAIAKKNRKTLEWEWDRKFDSYEFKSAMQQFSVHEIK